MPIGTSDGEYFDNHFESMVEGNVTAGLKRVYITPSTDSEMPLGSPTEPAGAFKSEGGTQTPEKGVNTKGDPGFFNKLLYGDNEALPKFELGGPDPSKTWEQRTDEAMNV